jgi:SAM-dependent methyltransferase
VGQNIYDDESFFAAYALLPRSVDGLGAAPEWPTLRSMLPAIDGGRVLDLGCGYGWFCRWALEQGADRVVGVDLSERMLTKARASTSDARIEFERLDLDEIELPTAAFDLVYSSLTLHYVSDLSRLVEQIHACLTDRGVFVFSIEHPIFTAPTSPRFVTDDDGIAWRLDRYLDEGPRTTDWLAPGVVKQHRTTATYVGALIDAGFGLTHLVEWGPSADDIAEHPDWAHEVERPPFLLVGARRIWEDPNR